MQASTLTSIILPLSLAIIMMGMGMALVAEDFKRVLRYPRAVALGLFSQLVLLPLVAFALIKLAGLEPTLAVGFMILAACPGGATSNLITHLARGDAALSVTLTAVTSLITVFSIPLVVNYALLHFTEVGAELHLPVLKTIIQVSLITLIPVMLGMLIRARAPAFAIRSQGAVKVGSILFLGLLIVLVVLKEKTMIGDNMMALGPIAILLNFSTMALGFAVARFFGLDDRQVVAIGIEVGVQNGTLGIVIATSLLANAGMAIPSVIYSLLMFMSAGAVIAYRHRPRRG